MSDEETLGILDVKVALEKTFPGCVVHMPTALGNSYHAEISFFEYDLRILLTGSRAKDRKIHFRFRQSVTHAGERKPTKRVITEFETTDPEELMDGIKEAAMYLKGVVVAIQNAFTPPSVKKIHSVEDLF